MWYKSIKGGKGDKRVRGLDTGGEREHTRARRKMNLTSKPRSS